MRKDEFDVYQDGLKKRKCVPFQIARSTTVHVLMEIAQALTYVIVTLDGKLNLRFSNTLSFSSFKTASFFLLSKYGEFTVT